MSTESQQLIQFGNRWVRVRDEFYYLSEYEVGVLKTWYTYTVEYGLVKASEEEIADMVEFFAKGFELLNPRNSEEALHFLTTLELLYDKTREAAKEIIERLYAERMRKKVEEIMMDE